MGRIFYIMGKSASGKDHIYKELLQDKSLRLFPLVLYTTRPMRENEVNGREYWFADEDCLEQLRRAGKIIEERVYNTVYGPWKYFTADEGIDLDKQDYLGIGTPESYLHLVKYFGQDRLVPLYIETEDGLRLQRALERERKQASPKYDELCRRFLADSRDFSEENLKKAGISYRFFNNDALETCVENIKKAIRGSV